MHPVVAMVRGSELIAYLEIYADDWTPDPGALKLEMVSDSEGKDAVALLTPSIQRLAPGRWGVTARTAIDPAQRGTRFVRATIVTPGSDPVRLTRAFTLESR